MRAQASQLDLADDTGASAVEFGFIAPVLFLLALGILQFGLIFTQLLQVEHAAAEGARMAALRYSAADISNAVRAAAPATDLTGAGAITITPADPANPAVLQNTAVTVRVATRVPVILPFFSAMMDADGDGMYEVDATSRQRIE